MKLFLRVVFMCFTLMGWTQKDDFFFPDDYLGSYHGNLVIKNANGEQNVGMEFHLQATDSVGRYVYKIVYIMDGNRQERDYRLIVKDEVERKFLIDENNGIVLEANYFDHTLYSVFEVQGNLLTTIETFYKDRMEFQIIFSKLNNRAINEDSEGVPEVKVHPVTVIQKANLIKQ